MLTYLHCYADDLWESYEKAGLLKGSYGIRFCQNVFLPEALRFNITAAKGTPLYEYIKKHKCPFYVDRLQGGVIMYDYTYDPALVKEYEDMLGDSFLGFQMHEWLSNYRGDVTFKLAELSKEDWTEEKIEAHIRKKYPYTNLFLESMTLSEIASAGKPETAKQMYDNMTAIYKDRASKYKLVPADSYYMMFPFEAEMGAKLLMPEVGFQIPDTRIQMCFARGVARAYGIKLGAYYEPWGGKPFTACCYEDDEKNEWHLSNAAGEFPFVTGGPNGGSSRSLQWRIYLYAYLSNCDYVCEEWGGYNTFSDRKNAVLSEYGIVKKRFIDFVEKYPDVGEKVAPIAAVLSNDLPCLTLGRDLPEDVKTYLDEPLEGERLEKWTRLKYDVAKIFSNSVPMVGDETQVLLNSDVPDAVDLLNEGDGKALEKYDYLVNLTCDPAFEKKHPNCITPDEVTEKLHELLPCRVDGGFHVVVNKRGEDGYYLSVFNHSGVTRSVAEGEKVLPEAEKIAVITLKDGRILTPLEGSDKVVFKNGKYHVILGGGEWFFAKF